MLTEGHITLVNILKEDVNEFLDIESTEACVVCSIFLLKFMSLKMRIYLLQRLLFACSNEEQVV